jgi:oxygen-independent coproporphyrinogen-3 oxidase
MTSEVRRALPEGTDELLDKYDRPGPRYTSYPTAPAWREMGPDDMRDALRRYAAADDAGTAPPLSLYVHVPFCAERCLYCGCNVVIAPRDKVSEPYLDALDQEITLHVNELGGRRRVSQLHLGGGTPTYLQPAQLERMIGWSKERFEFLPDAELSIEVDPVVTTEDHVRTLRRIGFNRISMGVQDLCPRVQDAVQRVQPAEMTYAFYSMCRDIGFESVNMDLIYGLPYQTVERFAETVDKVVEWGPDRVAVFNYAHVPWIKPHQERMPAEALPEPREKVAIFLETSRRFTAGGYEAIGIDHFAKKDDALAVARRAENLRRNFMGYTTQPETEAVAFGVTSISEISGTYAQNATRLSEYQRQVKSGQLTTHRGVRMSADDRLRNEVIMDLMCNLAIDKRRIEQRHGVDFDTTFADALEALGEMVDDGLVELSDDRIGMTERGYLFVRNAAMHFDAYLEPPGSSDKPLFSRTV